MRLTSEVHRAAQNISLGKKVRAGRALVNNYREFHPQHLQQGTSSTSHSCSPSPPAPSLPAHMRTTCSKRKAQPAAVLCFQRGPDKAKGRLSLHPPKRPVLPARREKKKKTKNPRCSGSGPRSGTGHSPAPSTPAGSERQGVPFPLASAPRPRGRRRSALLPLPAHKGKRRQQRHATPTAAAAPARSFRDASCAFLLLTLA